MRAFASTRASHVSTLCEPSPRTRLRYGAQQPGKRKLAMRVCQPAVLVAWPAAV